MFIGPYQIESPAVLAPMAGVTDRPFRMLCREMGAGLAASEMVTSDRQLWHSRKTQLRLDHTGEAAPRIVQIAGSNPDMMAEAAIYNVEHGAEMIDINMGCPKKKVCSTMAGSSLLKNEPLVADIINKVVNAVDVPVTLKIRTGWDKDSINAVNIAYIAESEGIQALTIHGRTRACAFTGQAEYETIAEVKSRISIPVIANGDIDSPEKAGQVLAYTGADAVMIGRAAQGRPWIFKEINHYLNTGNFLPQLSANQTNNILIKHIKSLYDFYGENQGVRIARKHISWYCKSTSRPSGARLESDSFIKRVNKIESADVQLELVAEYFLSRGRLQAA